MHRTCSGAHKLQNDTHCVPSQSFHLPLPTHSLCCPTPTVFFDENKHLSSLISHRVSFVFCLVYSFLSVCDLPFSSLFLSKANSTSTGQLDKLVSPGLSALTPESEEEHSLPPQRVSTFRPRPYSMADSNKVRNMKALKMLLKMLRNHGNSVKNILQMFYRFYITDHFRIGLSAALTNQVT